MSHTRLALPALAAIALAVSGCGGGSSKSSSQATSSAPTSAQTSAQTEPSGRTETAVPGKPLTRAELVARANTICRGIVAKLNAGSYKTPQELARIAPPLASFERGALAELRTLTPPASLAGDWKQVVASVRVLAANTAKMGEILKSGSAGPHTLGSLIAANYKVREPMLITAAHDGFHECAEVQ